MVQSSLAGEETGFFDGLVRVANELGFEYCAYFGVALAGAVCRDLLAIDNFPAAWQARYREKGYREIDPALKAAMQSTAPLLWSARIFAAVPEMQRDARACGLNHGWSQCSARADGAVGILTLVRSSGAIRSSEVRAKASVVAWLADAAYLGLSRRHAGTAPGVARDKISAREIEILRWTAEGKTAGEVAMIMGITERTVGFHIERLAAKLGAVNKTQAVAKAIRGGLI